MAIFGTRYSEKMKKKRLTNDYPIDFELIGIVSSAKEFKLAWHLNQLDMFHLVKGDDIKIDLKDNRQIRISNLFEETDYTKVHLLKNRLVSANADKFLLGELQQFDYLVKLSNQTMENWADDLLLKLKEIPVISYAMKIDIGKVKMKDNLLF